MVQASFSVTRCDIWGNENPIVPGDNTTIQDSWLHGLKAPGSPHYDGIQIDGGQDNVMIRHNTIENANTQTAAVMVDNYYGAATNITITGNKLTGGGYTVYADGAFASGAPITVSFTNNVFGKGYYGYGLIRGSKTTATWTGNTDVITGNAIPRP